MTADKIYSKLLEENIEVNGIIANNLLQTYAKSGLIDRAFDFYSTFQDLNITTNSYIISSLLSACTVAKDSRRIDEVRALMSELGIPENIHILNCLSEACVSCNKSIDNFEDVFLRIEPISHSDRLLNRALTEIGYVFWLHP